MGQIAESTKDQREMTGAPTDDSQQPSDAPGVGGTELEGGLGQLLEEHRDLDRLFDELSSTSSSGYEKKKLIIHIRQAISEHEDVEASVLAPVIRSRLDDGHRLWRSSRRRYRLIEKLLGEIDRRSISSPDLSELLVNVETAVDQLIADQESSIFPRLRSILSPDELKKLNDGLTAAHCHATIRPHPYLPHRGVLGKDARAGMAIVDKFRDRLTPRL